MYSEEEHWRNKAGAEQIHNYIWIIGLLTIYVYCIRISNFFISGFNYCSYYFLMITQNIDSKKMQDCLTNLLMIINSNCEMMVLCCHNGGLLTNSVYLQMSDTFTTSCGFVKTIKVYGSDDLKQFHSSAFARMMSKVLVGKCCYLFVKVSIHSF